MTLSKSSRRPLDSTVSSTRAFDRLVAPTIIIATAMTLGLLYADTHSDPITSSSDGVLPSSLMWTMIGAALATRGLWDADVAARGTPFRRLGRTIGKWYGWVGLLTSAVLIVCWITTAPGTWLTTGLIVGAACAAALMLFVKGVPRKIGAGLLVVWAAPFWPYIAFGFGPYVFGGIVLTLFAAIGSSIAEISTRRARRKQHQSHLGVPPRWS